MSTRGIAARHVGRGRVLSSPLLGFVIGTALASTLFALERILHHGYVYQRAEDALLHLSLAVLVGMGVGVVLGVPVSSFVAMLRRTDATGKACLITRTAAVVGLAAGVALYALVVAPSKFGHVVNPAIGAMIAGAGTSGSGALCASLLTRAATRWRSATASLLAGPAAVLVWIDAHAYVRSYGNVHVVATLTIWLLSGAACVLLVSSHSLSKRTWAILGLIAIAAALHVALAPTSMSARMAVLELGGGEKLVIQHVLWPLFDRDGDGHATAFWGPDCDDSDPTVVPGDPPYRAKAFGCAALPATESARTEAQERPTTTPSRSLIWIVIDTWRADTPKSLPRAFGSFLHLQGFRSCGSRTRHVLERLLGMSCAVDGPTASIPRALTDAGYAVKAFSQYDFHAELLGDAAFERDPDALVGAARTWIQGQERQQRPYFAFLHFTGGHAPYKGPGRTARERYESSVEAAVRRAARLIEPLASDPVFVVMGDHGEEFGEHEAGTHASSLYEEVLATPLFVRAPGWPSGVRTNSIGCDDLRVLIGRAMEGAPFELEGRNPVFATLDSPRGVHGGLSRTLIHAVRFDDHWKVIWKPHLDLWELYDLSADPRERTNLADREPERLRAGASVLVGALQGCHRKAPGAG